MSALLAGRRALITGAAGDIGSAIAGACVRHGAAVVAWDADGAALDALAERLGGALERRVVDVAHAAAVDAAAADADVDVLVNAAGVLGAPGLVTELSPQAWQRVLDVNLNGVFLCCQAEGRRMLEQGRGVIVNIASMSGTIVNRDLLQAHYNASKAAVMHLTKSLAMEWAARGIRVNSISPGYTATAMTRRPEVAEQVRRFEADTPLGRLATPEEMVGPTVFLLSEAAAFCTGVDLIVDGGFVCW